MAGFHRLRLAVQQNAGEAGPLPTMALHRELEQALAGSGLFETVELGRTEDPNQMVIGLCRCDSEILPWEAGLGVERLWRAVTGDFDWEAHTVECTESMMEFEGAVTVDDRGLRADGDARGERPGRSPDARGPRDRPLSRLPAHLSRPSRAPIAHLSHLSRPPRAPLADTGSIALICPPLRTASSTVPAGRVHLGAPSRVVRTPV